MKLDGKMTVTVSPAPSRPVKLGVKPTVQVTFAWFAAEFAPASKVTLLGLFCGAITTLPPGLAAVVSLLVLTLKVVFANVCGEGFVIPAIVSAAAPLAASAQVPELSASVIVTVCPAVEPVAEQLAKLPASVIAGVGGTTKLDGKTAVIVSPVRSAPVVLFAPVADAVNPTVQFERALPVCDEPENDTAVGAVTGPTTTLEEAASAVVSTLVLTVNEALESVCALGLVIPATMTDVAVAAGSEHVPPLSASVIVTVVAAAVPVAEQLVKPAPSATAGVGGIVRLGAKTAVIVSPARSAPDVLPVTALELKLAVQVPRAAACWGDALNETAVGAVAAAIVADGLTGVVSALVLTVTVDEPVVTVFVMPAT